MYPTPIGASEIKFFNTFLPHTSLKLCILTNCFMEQRTFLEQQELPITKRMEDRLMVDLLLVWQLANKECSTVVQTLEQILKNIHVYYTVSKLPSCSSFLFVCFKLINIPSVLFKMLYPWMLTAIFFSLMSTENLHTKDVDCPFSTGFGSKEQEISEKVKEQTRRRNWDFYSAVSLIA